MIGTSRCEGVGGWTSGSLRQSPIARHQAKEVQHTIHVTECSSSTRALDVRPATCDGFPTSSPSQPPQHLFAPPLQCQQPLPAQRLLATAATAATGSGMARGSTCRRRRSSARQLLHAHVVVPKHARTSCAELHASTMIIPPLRCLPPGQPADLCNIGSTRGAQVGDLT